MDKRNQAFSAPLKTNCHCLKGRMHASGNADFIATSGMFPFISQALVSVNLVPAEGFSGSIASNITPW